jgi:hypothetical protein
MQIIYNVPQVFYPGSDKVLDAQALRALMNLLVVLNKQYIVECRRKGVGVPFLYKSGVRYDRTLWWEPIPALYDRTYGDCKSLTGAMVAQLQLRGINCEPVFRWVERENGAKDYHILVLLPNGTFEDPSKKLGMPVNEVTDFYGPSSWPG